MDGHKITADLPRWLSGRSLCWFLTHGKEQKLIVISLIGWHLSTNFKLILTIDWYSVINQVIRVEAITQGIIQ